MNIGKLLKYSLYLLIMTLAVFLILTIYLYYFSNKPTLEIAYSFVVPICIFIVTLFYSRSVHERGLLRGIEMWVVYFAFVLIMKVLFKYSPEVSIVRHLMYLPVSIVGGIIGVNLKQGVAQK